MIEEPQSQFFKATGVTNSERYLAKLARGTFLSLWSYTGVYRDQGKHKKIGDGKEVCDLLVVFGEHLIIFSDKDCEFHNTGNLELDWSRWYRKAVEKSADQVWGAERWIREHPDRLFLDRNCTIPFPINLPSLDSIKIHRVVVAHGASERCREEFGGSGSLMIDTLLNGTEDYKTNPNRRKPFFIGRIDPFKGFVHVLDDTTLDILLSTLDTIADFVAYLQKKEEFLRNGRDFIAAGEEELLAKYLGELNKEGEHDFVVPKNYNLLIVDEGF